MFNRNIQSKYNQQKMNRAITSVVLRIIVAGYIIFIAVNVINGTKSETSTIPGWAGSLIGGLFIAASAGFIIYSIIMFRKALYNARLDVDEATERKEEKPAPAPEMTIAEKVRSAQAALNASEKHGNDQ